MRLIPEEEGATAAEYALMIAFIAVLLAVGVGLVGDSVRPPLARVAAVLRLGDDPAATAASAATGSASARGGGDDPGEPASTAKPAGAAAGKN